MAFIARTQLLPATVRGVDTVDISTLSNAALLARARVLAQDERERLLELLEVLSAIDERRAYQELNCLSLHEYCVFSLGYSDAAAYRRIRAIRAIRLFPPIIVLLRQGRLNVETTAMLHPYLEGPDAAELVSHAAGMRKWQVARLIAERKGVPPARDVLRFAAPIVEKPSDPLPLLPIGSEAFPTPAPSVAVMATAESTAEARPAPPQPPFSVRVSFTANAAFWRDLEFARSLLRHKYPDGKLEGVLGDALRALLDKKDRGRAFKLPPRPPRKMAK